jgi:hypothetical protein
MNQTPSTLVPENQRNEYSNFVLEQYETEWNEECSNKEKVIIPMICLTDQCLYPPEVRVSSVFKKFPDFNHVHLLTIQYERCQLSGSTVVCIVLVLSSQ